MILDLRFYGRRARLVYALMAVNLVGYAIESALSRNPFWIDYEVAAYLGMCNFFVVNYGWWWQLFTAMFMHADIFHIMFNMFWLWILGAQCERIFGGATLVFTYLGTGLLGNLLTLALSPLATVSLGASGAIFGIFGLLTMYQGMLGGRITSSILWGLFIFLVNIRPNVNIWAHLGGLIGGLLIGYYYGRLARRVYLTVM